MSTVVPNVAKIVYLQDLLEETLTLKLYSNNKTPAVGDTAGSYTEVAGGGYEEKTLAPASWNFTSGNPASAAYPFQDFEFDDETDAPGTVYGYYVVSEAGVLRFAERFEEASVPFEPAEGSVIRITPRVQLA